jgi:hypothetical protein
MNKSISSIIVLLLCFSFHACKKDGPSIPMVITCSITDISYTEATVEGEVMYDGGAPVLFKGICWSTLPEPTIINDKSSEGKGLGPFSSRITKLKHNSLYYVRAYATNSAGTAYGNQEILSTYEIKVPILTTIEITSISQKNAVTGGIVVNDNGGYVIERGVCWSTEPEPKIHNNKIVNGWGEGLYTSYLSNLSPSNIYYVRAYAINDAGTGYGNELSFKTQSQTILYDKTFNYPNAFYTLDGMSVENTEDGGHVIAGHVAIDGNGFDLLILKIDSFGNEQWNSVIDMNYGVEFGSIKQTTDEGYIVANGARITKLHQNGELKWLFPKNIRYFCNCEYYKCAIETTDNNYIAGGHLDTLINGVWRTMATITKLSNEGQVLWQKIYGSNKKTFGCYLSKTADGNYILIGNTGNDNDYDMNFWVMKFDTDGNIIWDKRYNDETEEWAMQIELTSDEGFIISGYSYRERQIVDARILKINANGILQWDKAYFLDFAQNFKTYAYGIEQTKDGGYIFSGANGYSPSEGLLVKLDPYGEITWKRNYRPDFMDFDWRGYDVKQTPDRGYIMVGRKDWIWNGQGKEKGLWILKTDENGNFNY